MGVPDVPAEPELQARTEPVVAPVEPAPAPPPLTPQSPLDDESRWKRITFLLLALAVAAGVWFFLFSFLALGPGRPGIDENAYLVGGRNIAQHGTTGFKPGDDYQFVGAMWIRTKDGWYYPKYPFGVSLLHAIPFMFRHCEWAFAVSPLCTALAVLGMFFLARDIVGSFYALLAMIVLATGPTTLQLAILPNSHAPALCAVVWGMFFLLRWYRTGNWPTGVMAGLILGFAVTTRYTEALLLFPLYSLKIIKPDQYIGPKLLTLFKVLGLLPLGPIAIAAMWRVKWKDWRSYFKAAMPIFGWSLPVGILVIYNLVTIGHVTGYDDTGESSGFSVDYFLNKWDFAVYQIYVFGVFIFAPLGVAGLILMFRGAWRTALLLTLWLVPGVLLYTAYYWGANMPSIGFLRFLLTLFPPLIIAAMWLLRSTENRAGKRGVATPIAAGVLTAITALVGVWGSLGELERQHRGNLNLQFSVREITSHIKASPGGRPMILADEGLFPQLLQYLQFMYDADWYPSDIFAPRAGGGFGLAGVFQQASASSNSPVTLQRERMQYIDSVRKGKSDADFVRDQQHLVDQALSAGRHVYVVLPQADADYFRKRFISSPFEMIKLDEWIEPCAVHFPEFNDRNWLALPVWGDDKFIPWHPQPRAMFEIRRAPAPASTTPSASGESAN